MKYFKTIFQSTDWDLITQTSSANDSYDIFLERFIKIYDQAFPERKIEIKKKNLPSPWISKGLRKSSKRKQRLYEQILIQRSDKNYETYKIYKDLFEKLEKQSKKLCFQNRLKKYKNNIKNTWNIMKGVIGKSKICNDKFPKSLDINKEEITDKKIKAETLNKFFKNIVSNLADKIQLSSINFESNLPNITTALSNKPLSEIEFKDAFFTLKTNKRPGYDNFHVIVIRSMYHELKIPLNNSFSRSLSTGIFPDK